MPSRKAQIRTRKFIKREESRKLRQKGIFSRETSRTKIYLLQKIKANIKIPKTPDTTKKIMGYLHQFGPQSYRYRSTSERLHEIGKTTPDKIYKPTTPQKAVAKIVDKIINIVEDTTRVRERIKGNLVYKVISPVREVVRIANSIGARLTQNYVVVRKKGTQEVVGIVPATKTLEISAQKYETEVTTTPPPDAPVIKFGRGGRVTRVTRKAAERPTIQPATREGYEVESALVQFQLAREPTAPDLDNPEFTSEIEQLIKTSWREQIIRGLQQRQAVVGDVGEINEDSLSFSNVAVRDILFSLQYLRRVNIRAVSQTIEAFLYQRDDGSWIRVEGRSTNVESNYPNTDIMNQNHIIYEIVSTGTLSSTRESILQNIRSYGYSDLSGRSSKYPVTDTVRVLTSNEVEFENIKSVFASVPEKKPTDPTPDNKSIYIFAVLVSDFDVLSESIRSAEAV